MQYKPSTVATRKGEEPSSGRSRRSGGVLGSGREVEARIFSSNTAIWSPGGQWSKQGGPAVVTTHDIWGV
jgi:hypothetical protein